MVTRELDPEQLRQLGAAVRAAREAADLSQRQLAAEAHVSYSWLQQLERGVRPNGEPVAPKAHNLLILARQLNERLRELGRQGAQLDEAQLLELAGHRAGDYVDTRAGRPTVGVQSLAHGIAQLEEDERRVIAAMVDVILRAKGIPAESEAPAKQGAPGTMHSAPRGGRMGKMKGDNDNESEEEGRDP